MFRICQLDPDWVQEGLTYYNVTPEMPEFQDYADTVSAYNWNSLCVPTIASYAILFAFIILVLIATIFHLLREEKHAIFDQLKHTKWIKTFLDQLLCKPLMGKRHAQKVGHRFLSIHLPLRGQTIILFGLFLANLLPVVAFYRLFIQNNLYWPQKSVQLGRYLSDRSGIIATAQMPPLILLSGRNNPVTWLTGMSFDSCMLYHRWIARFVFIQVLIHAIGYSIISVWEGGIAEYHELFVDAYFRWGCAATVAFGPLVFFSLRYLRQKSYEIFLAIHILMAIVALVGTYYHIHLLAVQESGAYRDLDNWMYAAIFFFAFDKIVRFARIILFNIGKDDRGRMRISTVDVDEIVAGQGSTVLRLKVHLFGWVTRHKPYLTKNSSRFAQIWFPKLSPFSSHPFTVADVQNDYVYFYVKKQKGITDALHKKILEREDHNLNQVALLEGFYGESVCIEHFDRSLIISGGIGITRCLPLFIRAAKAGKNVELFWIVQEREMLTLLIDVLQRQSTMSSGEEEEEEVGKGSARITVHITNSCQAEVGEVEAISVLRGKQSSDNEQQEDKKGKQDNLMEMLKKETDRVGITVSIKDEDGRPDVSKVILANPPSALFSCGPASLCDDIRSAKGNAELFEEAFEW